MSIQTAAIAWGWLITQQMTWMKLLLVANWLRLLIHLTSWGLWWRGSPSPNSSRHKCFHGYIVFHPPRQDESWPRDIYWDNLISQLKAFIPCLQYMTRHIMKQAWEDVDTNTNYPNIKKGYPNLRRGAAIRPNCLETNDSSQLLLSTWDICFGIKSRLEDSLGSRGRVSNTWIENTVCFVNPMSSTWGCRAFRLLTLTRPGASSCHGPHRTLLS